MKRSDEISQKVLKYCESHGMLAQGDKVLLGVSGGADSVCLLFLLHEISKRMKLRLRVVHVVHGIRKEGGADAEYVRSLCEILEIPFVREDVDVPALAKREGLSEEEAGRKARYEIFERLAAQFMEETEPGEGKANEDRRVKIALAHHAGDQAETFLFHLFRGSGLKGLAGILPVRETQTPGVMVIRPLLCLERQEIEAWLKEKDVSFCQDATNDEDEHARNRIRHHVLPYAEKEICNGAIRHVSQAAQALAEAESFMAAETEKAAKACVTGDEEKCVNVESFLKQPAILQKRILKDILWELSPGHKDYGAVHVESVLDLFSGSSGRSVNLPYGICARREYESVVVTRDPSGKAFGAKESRETESGLNEGKEIAGSCEIAPEDVCETPKTLELRGYRFEFQRLPYKKGMLIPENTYTKWFDYDKIKNTLSIRTRQTGDFLMIRGAEGKRIRKPVKEYFITEKIPRDVRNSLPLLTEGQQVLWIPGYRIGENYKVDEGTKVLLQVQLKKE